MLLAPIATLLMRNPRPRPPALPIFGPHFPTHLPDMLPYFSAALPTRLTRFAIATHIILITLLHEHSTVIVQRTGHTRRRIERQGGNNDQTGEDNSVRHF